MDAPAAMITVLDPDLSSVPSRYYAADFHKLTNRRASSPITPDFPFLDRVVPARGTLPSAATTTADRRAFSRHNARRCVVQGAPADFRSRQGSGSSIKEDAGGEITHRFVNIFTCLHSFPSPSWYSNSLLIHPSCAQA